MPMCSSSHRGNRVATKIPAEPTGLIHFKARQVSGNALREHLHGLIIYLFHIYLPGPVHQVGGYDLLQPFELRSVCHRAA